MILPGLLRVGIANRGATYPHIDIYSLLCPCDMLSNSNTFLFVSIAAQVHTLQMTSKKLEAYRRETEQLFYSMSGAEIFFKRTDVDT